MKLNYGVNVPSLQKQVEDITNNNEPQEETFSYFSPKVSDKYSSFVNMQQVVNTALKKNTQPNPNDKTELPNAQEGIRYDV